MTDESGPGPAALRKRASRDFTLSNATRIAFISVSHTRRTLPTIDLEPSWHPDSGGTRARSGGGVLGMWLVRRRCLD